MSQDQNVAIEVVVEDIAAAVGILMEIEVDTEGDTMESVEADTEVVVEEDTTTIMEKIGGLEEVVAAIEAMTMMEDIKSIQTL